MASIGESVSMWKTVLNHGHIGIGDSSSWLKFQPMLDFRAAAKANIVNTSQWWGEQILLGPHFVWSWWRHQMETFSALLAICARNSPVPGEFPAQRPATRSFDVFYHLHPNKRLSKQWWGWWFETPPCLLRRHRNVLTKLIWVKPVSLHWSYSR